MATPSHAVSGIWAPFKELFSAVEAVIVYKKEECFSELEDALTKNKPAFISLLQNPGKDSQHREKIKKASKDGIQLQGQTGVTKLTEQFIQEALVLSDVLDLNEYSCVELLLAAELQLPNFPGFTRGLVAVLLYHDGRRCLLSGLKLIITAREGITWTLELNDQISRYITSFTEKLHEDGLLNKILQQLQSITVQQELDKLQHGQVLGDGKHKKLLTELIGEQRQLLSDCLFNWACQTPLNKKTCIDVMDFLKQATPNTSDGSLDHVTLRVVMTLFVTMDTAVMDMIAEGQETVKDHNLPVLCDSDFVIDLHQAIIRPDSQVWKFPGIKPAIQFAWAVLMRSCGQHQKLASLDEILEEDESVLDAAIENDAFKFLTNCLVNASGFHEEEYFVKTLHTLLTGFIVKFPLKTKELRNKGDENARIVQAHRFEGVEPPQGLRHDFQDFMLLVGELYKKDPCGLELCTDYWCPPEPLGGVFSPKPTSSYKQSINQRKIMLNKFVRLSGDLLLQPMYVPYIQMLTGLSSNPQAAHFSFNLLSSDGNLGRGGACSVSWDHFFYSFKQYYSSLRQDLFSTEHHAHIHHHHSISPEEESGLVSVLDLVRIVADQSESVRIAFCENQSWLPVASFFGLIGCPVSPVLKAALLETLAAFAKSPEIASVLWQSLEATQILETVKESKGSTQEAGIKIELEEIESRNESYPETRAFCKLISRLTDLTIPSTLGAGYRIPGFDPFLEFLRDNVFMKFKGRAYQDSIEKWKVAAGVLEIFVKILDNYDPQPEHFVDQDVEIQGVSFGKASKPPGYQLMMHMMNETPMFRLVMAIIDESSTILEECLSPSDRREDLQKAAYFSLRLVENALEKQELFQDLFRAQNSSVLVTPIDQMLLGINARTGQADYLYRIARYIVLNNVIPELTLSVVRILYLACQSSTVQMEIVAILSNKQVEARELLVGFSEHLEIDLPEDTEEKGDSIEQEFEGQQAQSRNAIRHSIIRLLLSTLEKPTPNLAQFLLGFDHRKAISQTSLQDPGIGGFPKSCLHSVIEVLSKGMDSTLGPPCVTDTPKLAELMYQLIYLLCAHLECGGPVQRYLRTNHDFFVLHGQCLPFTHKLKFQENIDKSALLLVRVQNQQSWLLKTIAIEIKMAAYSRLRSNMTRVLAVLYGEPNLQARAGGGRRMESSSQYLDKTSTLEMSRSGAVLGALPDDESTRNLISHLLSGLQFDQDFPTVLGLNFFDFGAVNQLIASCEEKSHETGVVLCNIKRLYKIIMAELNSAQGTAGVGQRPELMKEVKNVLEHAVERNFVRESLRAKRDAFEAWRQVIETTFAVCPNDVLPSETKEIVILELLQELLVKIGDADAIADLTSPVAGTVLMLMAQYSQTASQHKEGRAESENTGEVNMGSLLAIFKGLVDCIIKAGGAQTRMRANLYGAVLYYMQIGKQQKSIADEGVGGTIFGPQLKESWESNTLTVLSKYGESFMEVLCRDACDSPDIAKMLALAVLESLHGIDWQQRWLSYLSSHGYLRHLIDNFVMEDGGLQTILASEPESMRPLYTFESKMSFLTKVAQTELGAQSLLQYGLTSRLSECQFLDQRPGKDSIVGLDASKFGSMSYDPLIPAAVERYRIVFTAVGKLILAIMSSLGPAHKDAVMQVQLFVLSHEDTFLGILQDRSPDHSLPVIQELAITLSIVSLFGINEVVEEFDVMTDEQRRLKSFMNRIQRLMLALMQRFSSKDYCEKVIRECYESETQQQLPDMALTNGKLVLSEIIRLILQIRSSVFNYARNVVASSGLSGPYCRLLFAPSFTDNIHKEPRAGYGRQGYRSTSMSTLVQELKYTSDSLLKTVDIQNNLCKKMDNVQDVSQDEIKQLLAQGSITEPDKLPVGQRHQVVKKVLQNLIDLRDDQACLMTQIIENVLYILWRHIEYYYIHCVPVEEDAIEFDLPRTPTVRARRLQDVSSLSESSSVFSPRRQQISSINISRDGVTKEQIRELQIEAPSLLSKQLLKKVLETEQAFGKTRSRLGFTSAMVRRIQGLLNLHGS